MHSNRKSKPKRQETAKLSDPTPFVSYSKPLNPQDFYTDCARLQTGREQVCRKDHLYFHKVASISPIMHGSHRQKAYLIKAAPGGYYEGMESVSLQQHVMRIIPPGFMKSIRRPSIHFFLAFLSFISLAILPGVAGSQSCCMSTEKAEQSCMCSQSSPCCQDSTPASLASDNASVTVKPVRHAQIPHNAATWNSVFLPVQMAKAEPVFIRPARPVDASNKRYLMLRVLLI